MLQQPVILDLEYVKQHLQVQHNFDDTYLFELILGAHDRFHSYVQRPIFSTEEVVQVSSGGTKIILDYFPCDSNNIVVRDLVTNEELSEGEVQLDTQKGIIYRTNKQTRKRLPFQKGIHRWEVAYFPGLEHHAQWNNYLEEAIRTSLRDLIADWYENRAPILGEERFGGGSVISYRNLPLSHRVQAVWDDIGHDIL